MSLLTPSTIVDVYIAEYLEIETPRGVIKGNVKEIGEQFKASPQKLHQALNKYFNEGKIKIKFKTDE